MRAIVQLFLMGAATAGALAASAQGLASTTIEMTSPPATDQRLDSLRGGADLGGDLHVSFGLERLTTVNGQVVASTQFQLQDLSRVTPAEALAAQHALGSLLTLNDGHASTTALPLGNQSVATVIQNSLPNQVIKNVLTLSLTTNSLAMLRASNAADQLRNLSLPGH